MSTYTMNQCNSIRSNRNNSKSWQNTIFLLYTFFVSLIYILPFFKYVVSYKIAAILMLIPLPFLSFFDNNAFKFSVILLVFSAVSFIQNALLGMETVDAVNEAVRNIRFFLPALFGYAVLNRREEKRSKCVFLIAFLFVIGCILLKTSMALNKNPMIARILAQDKSTSSASINAYRLANIGGFEFSYMMGILALAFLELAYYVKKSILKIVYILLYIASFYYIIQTMYTTLLILAFLGSVLIVFVNSKNLIFRICLCVFAGLFLIFLPTVLQFLVGLFKNSSVLSYKFELMLKALTDKNVNELGRRPELIMSAIQNWIESPLFGVYDSQSNAHSLFFSLLERNGLLGISMWIYIFIQAFKLIKNGLPLEKRDVFFIGLIFCYVFALSILNPIGYVFEVTIAAFFVVPMGIAYFAKQDACD